MKPAPFTYHAPGDLTEALDLLGRLGPDCKVLAGGQSLVPVLNMRLANPTHLVDLNGVPGLDTVTVTDEAVHVGALVRHSALLADRAAADALPLLGQALRWVAHPVIRNRGTTVGSLVHADPAAEMPAVLALTGGHVVLRSVHGDRRVGAEAFFVGPMECCATADELAIEAVFPRFPAGTRTAVGEIARRHGDYALAGVAVAVQVGQDDGQVAVRTARASFISLSEVPLVLDLTSLLAGAVAADLAGEELGQRLTEEVAAAVDPVSDIHASADYRRHLAAVQSRALIGELLTAPPDVAPHDQEVGR